MGARRTVRVATAIPVILVLMVIVTGCGGSSAAEIAPFTGAWLRVDAGEPNPDLTLTISQVDGEAEVTFANHVNGMSETSAATVEDGVLACLVTTAGGLSLDVAPTPSATAAAADLRLSLDEHGQLVVDVVLSDGTLEPISLYERAPGSDAGEP